MSNNHAKRHSWPYQPRHWERTLCYSTSWYDADRPDKRGQPACPGPDFAKESPGKDGDGEFPEDGLLCG